MIMSGMVQPKLPVDLAWLNKVSFNLERFKKVKNDVFNARCPICGDSKKDKKLCRWYAFVKKGSLFTYCHKCGYSKSFYGFMKDAFPLMFEEYKRETLFDSFKNVSNTSNKKTSTTTLFEENNATQSVLDVPYREFAKNLIPISDLDDNHPALMYLKSRGFTVREYGRLLYTDDFAQSASILNPESAKSLGSKEPRIVIPFVSPEGSVEIIQGRSLNPNSSLRYITIKRREDSVKLYGRYDLDEAQPVRCVEGPLDSLFVDNCIATCDGNLNRSDADVLIWDLQPRNPEILKYMEEAIENGRGIVIWPIIPDKKLDINDLIKKGMSRKDLMTMIDTHTYTGLTAKLKFTQWKRM